MNKNAAASQATQGGACLMQGTESSADHQAPCGTALATVSLAPGNSNAQHLPLSLRLGNHRIYPQVDDPSLLQAAVLSAGVIRIALKVISSSRAVGERAGPPFPEGRVSTKKKLGNALGRRSLTHP